MWQNREPTCDPNRTVLSGLGLFVISLSALQNRPDSELSTVTVIHKNVNSRAVTPTCQKGEQSLQEVL